MLKTNLKTREELLQLIESDDAFTILYEENLEGFNELIKYEMVCIKDDKIYLTDLGKEAQIQGVKNVIARRDVDKIISDITEKPGFKIDRTYLYIFLMIIILGIGFWAFK